MMCPGVMGEGFWGGWGLLGDSAVVGQVRGCPGIFLAALANLFLMPQIRSELWRQGPA